jgi:hypothetical protein
MGLCRFPAFLIALTAPNIVYWLTSHIDHSTVRLWRYFSKVTLIHGAIAELESAARSTRLYRLFRKKLIVEIVDYPRIRVTLPTSKDAWTALINTASNSAHAPKRIGPQVVHKTAAALATRFSNKSVSCEIHCECKILQHFTTTTTTFKIKPINYIGVSKLSCVGCAAVFASYNKLQDSRTHRFYTRGAHSKWYFPWVLPKVGGVQQLDFTNRVYRKLAKQYAKYLEALALSDSSALSQGDKAPIYIPKKFDSRNVVFGFLGAVDAMHKQDAKSEG